MQPKALLERCCGTGAYVSLATPFGPDYSGFIVKLSRHWCLLQSFYDFYPEGYTCLRRSDIVQARKPNRFFQKVFKKEGLFKKDVASAELDIESASSILRTASRLFPLLILDFDYDEEKSLYLGRVRRLYKHHLLFDKLYADGRWGTDNPHKVQYGDISTLRFGTGYDAMFAKHGEQWNASG